MFTVADFALVSLIMIGLLAVLTPANDWLMDHVVLMPALRHVEKKWATRGSNMSLIQVFRCQRERLYLNVRGFAVDYDEVNGTLANAIDKVQDICEGEAFFAASKLLGQSLTGEETASAKEAVNEMTAAADAINMIFADYWYTKYYADKVSYLEKRDMSNALYCAFADAGEHLAKAESIFVSLGWGALTENTGFAEA